MRYKVHSISEIYYPHQREWLRFWNGRRGRMQPKMGYVIRFADHIRSLVYGVEKVDYVFNMRDIPF